MLIDARKLDAFQIVRCDVCIIGGGPAGITMALELAKQGIDVVLLESGGKSFDRDAHDLDKGTTADPHAHGPLEHYRRRRLGGASTAWGGRSVPFDEIDFEPREFVPYSGWPIRKRDLDPYYERAHAYADLGAYSYAASDALSEPARRRPMVPGLDTSELTTEPIYRFSPPTNFGKKYETQIARSPSIRAFLNATVHELATNPERTVVECAHAITPNRRKLTVMARRYVVANGGLDATRLLMLSGIGNDRDLLGRFYQCHVTHRVDVELGPHGLVWDYERTREGVYCQRTLSLTEDAQRKRQVLNHRARVEHPEISDGSHESGALSAVYLAKQFLMRQAANPLVADQVNVLSKGVTTGNIVQPRTHVANVVKDFGGVLAMSKRWVSERILSDRKLPSVVLPSRSNKYTLRIDAEQVPNPDSRVLLGSDRDATGARRLHVDWRHSSLDVDSLTRLSQAFDEALVGSGIGRARHVTPSKLQATGGHHIGTTRMSSDPSTGVVDENCRVHGVANVFVASSSVFPTCSYANPTLTILALALRLGDHLAGQDAQRDRGGIQ